MGQPRRTRRSTTLAALAVAAFAMPLVAAPTARAADAAGAVAVRPSATPNCQDMRFSVKLIPRARPRYHVVGRLCGTDTTVIQVLLAGATEASLAYWDFPRRDYYEGNPATFGALRDDHSYAKYVADRGGTTLALDRIGTGASDHPPAELVTIESNAYVLHQVIQALRRGAGGTGPFSRVVTIGRSLAGAITYVESVRYGDVDGIITQSYSQTKQPAFATFPTTFQPAQADPRFASFVGGYITTRPGTRAGFFFTPNAAPAVVAHEEATKETLTDAEIPTFVKTFLPGQETARSVTVPVLSVLGDADTFWCSAPGCPDATQEASYFSQAACFQSAVVANVGHNMNLEPTAKTAVFPLLTDWVADNFGEGQVPCQAP